MTAGKQSVKLGFVGFGFGYCRKLVTQCGGKLFVKLGCGFLVYFLLCAALLYLLTHVFGIVQKLVDLCVYFGVGRVFAKLFTELLGKLGSQFALERCSESVQSRFHSFGMKFIIVCAAFGIRRCDLFLIAGSKLIGVLFYKTIVELLPYCRIVFSFKGVVICFPGNTVEIIAVMFRHHIFDYFYIIGTVQYFFVFKLKAVQSKTEPEVN